MQAGVGRLANPGVEKRLNSIGFADHTFDDVVLARSVNEGDIGLGLLARNGRVTIDVATRTMYVRPRKPAGR